MADRTSQQRDMVYCHSCENEWYRDEHGLECPECHSDFTEIIEPNHDPRNEPPPLEHDHGHAGFYGAPDPDEHDIGGIQWGPTGTQHRRINSTFTYGPGGFQREDERGSGQPADGQGGGLGGGLFGAIGSMLSGALGGQQNQRPQSPEVERERAQSAPGSPRTNTRVRTFNLPGGRGQFTYTATTMHMGQPGGGMPGPRNANGPQPFNPQPQMIDQMMAQMFANIMPGGGHAGLMFAGPGPFMAGGHGQAGMPINLFNLLGGGPLGGPLGDAVFSQEDLDRVITQLMEQHQAGNAPGPASEAAIQALPTRTVSTNDLDEKTGKAECSICMDEVQAGATITELPCRHWFHGECIKAWLGEHDTCPHCRQGIMPREGEGQNAQRPREPSQAPLNNMHSPEHQAPRTMPGGFPGLNRQESGSLQHPYTVEDSPGRGMSSSGPAQRRASRGSGSGGLLGRMREAFSPSGGDGSARGDDPGAKS